MNLGNVVDVEPLVLHAREARQPETYSLKHRGVASGPVVRKRNHVELADLHVSAVTIGVLQAHIEIFRLANGVQGPAVKDLRDAERNIGIRSDVFVSGRHIQDEFGSLRIPMFLSASRKSLTAGP